MIKNFRHKGLYRLYSFGDTKGINAEHLRKVRQILAVLHAAQHPIDLDLPTFRLHMLHGDLEGFWAVTVRANWRIVFRFEGTDAVDVNYEDYH